MKEREITKSNYFETIEDIGLKTLPPVLKQSHKVIVENTANGSDWGKYEGDENLKRMTDLAFKKLQEFVRTKHGLSGIENNVKQAKEDAKEYEFMETDKLRMLLRLEQDAELEYGMQPEIKIRKEALERIIAKREGKSPKKKNPYQTITKEISFIRRFLDLNDKIVYKKTLEILIDELQSAIQKKQITKKSPVAKDIMNMQQSLISVFNSTANAKHIILKPDTLKRMKAIIEKFENSYDDLDKDYVKAKKKNIGLKGLNGIKDSDILDSTEFIKMEFPALGFKDKWFDLIGDPCAGFTMMVYGMPKTGKSYLCVEFAGYLARNHGNVLYVAKEEKADSTLQKKIKEKGVAHPNLKITGALPRDLSSYKYVFLDSVNKLRLTPEDLERLKSKNKDISFVYVFQSTKGGQFKGNNEFKHDVDVVVEVPEIGKAVQYGRFNQGGTMNIFEKAPSEVLSSSEDLSGVKSSKEKSITIKPTLSVSLTEFEFLVERGETIQEAIINSKTEAENWAEKLTLEEISKAGAKVKVDAVYFMSNDDFEDEEQNSYYDIRLSGTEAELKKVSGKDKTLYHVWDNEETIEGKTKQRKIKDWTEPKHLSSYEHSLLKQIKKYYNMNEMGMAMEVANRGDTEVREAIPPSIWLEMGGRLTNTGYEKLKNEKKNKVVKVKKKRIYIPHTLAVKMIHDFFQEQVKDSSIVDFTEVLADAVESNDEIPALVKEIEQNVNIIFKGLYEAADKRKDNSK